MRYLARGGRNVLPSLSPPNSGSLSISLERSNLTPKGGHSLHAGHVQSPNFS